MDVYDACQLSRFKQAGRFDEDGNFWFVEWYCFLPEKIIFDSKTKKRMYPGLGQVEHYKDWQPIAPKK